MCLTKGFKNYVMDALNAEVWVQKLPDFQKPIYGYHT